MGELVNKRWPVCTTGVTQTPATTGRTLTTMLSDRPRHAVHMPCDSIRMRSPEPATCWGQEVDQRDWGLGDR